MPRLGTTRCVCKRLRERSSQHEDAEIQIPRKHLPLAILNPRALLSPRCACLSQIRSQAQNHKLKKKEYSERYRREARKADFGMRPGQEAVEITDDDRY